MSKYLAKKIYDISKWQGQPDFNKLRAVADALIIRVQYGSNVEDSAHKYDESMCKQYGIPFSAYAYGRYVSKSDAEVEAKNLIKRADPEAKMLVLDAEEVTTYDKGEFFDATQHYIDTLKASGKKVGFYTGEYFYKAHGFDKLTGIDVLWIAKYNTNDGTQGDKPSVPCDIWQFTSKAHVDGINGYVDESVFLMDGDFDWFFGIKKPEPKPQPKPAPVVHYVNYKVKSGDTLWDIAQHYKIPVADLIKANEKYAHLLPVGVTVRVPLPGPAPQPKPQHVLPKEVLKRGDKGKAVEELQYFLNKIHFNCGKIDGSYGPSTEDAVKRFQEVYLPYEVDGVFGPHTRQVMEKHI